MVDGEGWEYLVAVKRKKIEINYTHSQSTINTLTMDNFESFILTDDVFNNLKRYCSEEVYDDVSTRINENIQWSNEYGCLVGNERRLPNNVIRYGSTDDVVVSMHNINSVIYYKILPKNATNETCPFFSEPKDFDGYFLISKFQDQRDISDNIFINCGSLCYGDPDERRVSILYNGYYISWYG